jgi:hypothetical protein
MRKFNEGKRGFASSLTAGRKTHAGYGPTREAEMAAFAKSWRWNMRL